MTVNLIALAADIDELEMPLSDGFQLAVKIIVALFLFGIALDTRFDDFADVARRPWIIAAGVVAQFGLMPAVTLLLTLALDVRGSVAIGMILVACCPAGNLSNILTHRARGDVALSISMTATSTILAIAITPVSVAFWCGLNPAADALLRDIDINPWDMVVEAVFLIGLPFALGLLIAWLRPGVSPIARRVVEPAALTLLVLIVLAGLLGQWQSFVDYVGVVALAIVLQNAVALAIGYATARGMRLSVAGRRAMTLELGMRNTGLALVLAIGFFADLGGVAYVAALWGLWDVITGLLLSTLWRRHPPEDPVSEAPSTDAAPAG